MSYKEQHQSYDKESENTWSKRFWKKHDRLWKAAINRINLLEIRNSLTLKNYLNRPVKKPADNWANNLQKWQYRNQKNVREQQGRNFEQLFSGMGAGVPMLAFGLRHFSPDHLRSDENWNHASEIPRDKIMRQVGELPPDLDFPLHSISGLEWFFSVRLGAWFLETDKKQHNNYHNYNNYDSLSSSSILTAKFDSLSKYETKFGIVKINAQIWFSLNRQQRCLKWERMIYKGEMITECNHELFEDASRAIMCAATTDVSTIHHALHDHLLIGEIFASTTHNCLTDMDHPVRRFLQPFCYGIFDISNVVRTILLPENGTLHTIFGFSYKGLSDCINDTFDQYDMAKVHVLPEYLRSKGLFHADRTERGVDGALGGRLRGGTQAHHAISSALPIWQDAYEYWLMFESYTQALIKAAGYSCDEDVHKDKLLQCWAKEILRQQPRLDSCQMKIPMGLKDFRLLCCIFMYHSTISHEMASIANDLVSTPYAVTTQWRIPQNEMNLKSPRLESKISTRDISRRAVIAAHVISLKVKQFDIAWGYVMYPVEDNLWRKCHKSSAVRDIMNSIPSRLKHVDNIIEERNQKRKYPQEILRSHTLNVSMAV